MDVGQPPPPPANGPPPTVGVDISEREVLKLVLEFLENRRLHIAQVSLERETGVINGQYSEDILFLRQLILDGQWDSAVDFVAPLDAIEGFQARAFRFTLTKYKYLELLCLREEPGPFQNNEFTVEEIVACLKQLEELSENAAHFRQLCALLTLPKLSDDELFRNWNPNSARMECFHAILPLVANFIDRMNPPREREGEGDEHDGGQQMGTEKEHSEGERLLTLVVKGLLYEEAVDYCQAQALAGKNAPKPKSKYNKLLAHKGRLSPADLSLISWLEILGNEQFTVPFQQKALDFRLEPLKKPKLEAQWSEQILATPIKPGGQFPHSLVPAQSKLKTAQRTMFQSMTASLVFDTGNVSGGGGKHLLRRPQVHPMSQSTLPSVGAFSIQPLDEESEDGAAKNGCAMSKDIMRQSQIISEMLSESSAPPSTASDVRRRSSLSLTSGCGDQSARDNAGAQQQETHKQRELQENIYRRSQLQPLPLHSQRASASAAFAGGGTTALAPVPELSTPSGAGDMDAMAHFPNQQQMTQPEQLFQHFQTMNLLDHHHHQQRPNAIPALVPHQLQQPQMNQPPQQQFPPVLQQQQQAQQYCGHFAAHQPQQQQILRTATNASDGQPQAQYPIQSVPAAAVQQHLARQQQQQQLQGHQLAPVNLAQPQPITQPQMQMHANHHHNQQHQFGGQPPPPTRPTSMIMPATVHQRQQQIGGDSGRRPRSYVEQPFFPYPPNEGNNFHNQPPAVDEQPFAAAANSPCSHSYSMLATMPIGEGRGAGARKGSLGDELALEEEEENHGAGSAIGSSTAQNAIRFLPVCRYEDAQPIRAVSFHPSGHIFAIGTNSRQLLICRYPDVKTKSMVDSNSDKNGTFLQPLEILLARPKVHRGSVYCVAFSQNGDLIATGSNDKSIRLLSLQVDMDNRPQFGSELELQHIHDGTVRDLIFMEERMANGAQPGVLVSGGAGNCHICVTDCTTGRTFKSFPGHAAPILGFHNWCSSTSFVSCSQDKTIRFWDLRASNATTVIWPTPRTSNSPVTSVCVDPSGKLLVSGHEDASIMLYDICGGRTIQLYRPHGDEVRTVRFSNAAYYLLSGSYDNRIVITDMRGNLNDPLTYLPVAEHADKVIQCRWHPREFVFLSTSADKSTVLWSLPHLESER